MSRFEQIGHLLPRGIVRSIGKFLDTAGVMGETEAMVGTTLVFSLGLGLLVFIVSILSTGWLQAFSVPFSGLGAFAADAAGAVVMLIVIEAATLIAVSIALYAYLLVQIDARRRELESVLPDFLQLSAANVRAGLPIEQALWRAATPEFGILAKEVQIAMKRTFSGESISDSLTYLSNRFNSKYLQRTVSVLKFGIASGGEIGEILERTAADLRRMQIMYKEASSSMLMYVIFISFAAIFGAPILFAVSFKLIATLSAVWANVPAVSQGGFGVIGFSPPQITADDFKLFAILAISITSVFASFILAVIQTGSARDGLKILPFFLIAGLGVLFLVMAALDLMFTVF
ncbi:MAG: type II secretion system F family protein [Candidatus Micrarchaeota archaeon]|nr:type II secretion system F family protein [Candidatus Micrarchaeota archaeon]